MKPEELSQFASELIRMGGKRMTENEASHWAKELRAYPMKTCLRAITAARADTGRMPNLVDAKRRILEDPHAAAIAHANARKHKAEGFLESARKANPNHAGISDAWLLASHAQREYDRHPQINALWATWDRLQRKGAPQAALEQIQRTIEREHATPLRNALLRDLLGAGVELVAALKIADALGDEEELRKALHEAGVEKHRDIPATEEQAELEAAL
jgi:hypothetical protein